MADADVEALYAYYMQAADAEADADADAVAPVAPVLPPPALPGLPLDPLQLMQQQVALMQQNFDKQLARIAQQHAASALAQAPGGTHGLPQPVPPSPAAPTGFEAWEPELVATIGRLQSQADLGKIGRIIAATTGSGPGSLTAAGMMSRTTAMVVGGVVRKINMTQAVGSERLEIVAQLVEELNSLVGAPLAAHGVTPAAATAALVELYDAISPHVPMGAAPPDLAALLMEQARATRQADKDEKEFSASKITKNLQLLANQFGKRAPTRGQVLCPAQLKLLYDELVVHEMIPCHPSLELDKLLTWGGANGVVAARTKKDEDPEAADAKDATEMRVRFAAYVHSVGLVTAGHPDGDAIYGAALDMLTALERATSMSTLPQVRSGLRAAIGKARRMRNESGSPPSIADAYSAAAEVVNLRNDEAADPDRAVAAPKQTDAVLPADLAKMIADAATAAAKAASGRNPKVDPKKTKARKPVTCSDGKTRYFRAMPGGNTDCSVACTKSHGKDAVCEYHHKQK